MLLDVAKPALGGENGEPANGTATNGGVRVDTLLGVGAVLVVLLLSSGVFFALFIPRLGAGRHIQSWLIAW